MSRTVLKYFGRNYCPFSLSKIYLFSFHTVQILWDSERFVTLLRLSSCFLFSQKGEIKLEECNAYSVCDCRESDGQWLLTYVGKSDKKISLRIDGGLGEGEILK
jgi:hypothetical protein